jgi:hypothetical protein
MVVCSCRNIRDSQYNSIEELMARIMEGDHCCGRCLEKFLSDGDEFGFDRASNNLTATRKATNVIRAKQSKRKR